MTSPSQRFGSGSNGRYADRSDVAACGLLRLGFAPPVEGLTFATNVNRLLRFLRVECSRCTDHWRFLSGIGAAAQLRREYPSKTFTIIEARDAIGGTWDLFRYPGIRSDSDMFTMGYRFKPWTDENSIAAGDTIRSYIADVASEYDITDRIRFGNRAVRAEWSLGPALLDSNHS